MTKSLGNHLHHWQLCYPADGAWCQTFSWGQWITLTVHFIPWVVVSHQGDEPVPVLGRGEPPLLISMAGDGIPANETGRGVPQGTHSKNRTREGRCSSLPIQLLDTLVWACDVGSLLQPTCNRRDWREVAQCCKEGRAERWELYPLWCLGPLI